MNIWARKIATLTLICYLAVSSIAATHAFQSSLTVDTPQSLSLTDMGPNCHQKLTDNTDSNNCEIFCAATSNIIVGDIAINMSSSTLSTENVFSLQGALTPPPSIEPHPPK